MLFYQVTIIVTCFCVTSTFAAVTRRRNLNSTLQTNEVDLFTLVDEEKEEDEDQRILSQKSIFGPLLVPRCGEGFEKDDTGNCVRVIVIDEENLFAFYLERFNKMSLRGERRNRNGGQKKKNQIKQENQTAPERFHLKIPEIEVNETDEAPYNTHRANVTMIIEEHVKNKTNTTTISTIESTDSSTSSPQQVRRPGRRKGSKTKMRFRFRNRSPAKASTENTS